MFEKDYLMRLFTDFMNALNRIINNIDNNDIDGAKVKINEAYSFFGNDATYFLNTEVDEILNTFKNLEGDYLKRVQLLATLMHYDALTRTQHKKRRLQKAILLTNYYIAHTKEYSLEVNERLVKMKKALDSI